MGHQVLLLLLHLEQLLLLAVARACCCDGLQAAVIALMKAFCELQTSQRECVAHYSYRSSFRRRHESCSCNATALLLIVGGELGKHVDRY